MKSIQPIKTAAEIEAMRQGGKILASILNDLKQYVKAGMSELEVEEWVAKEIGFISDVSTSGQER